MRCSQCVPTPSFATRFETTIDAVCSGRCELRDKRDKREKPSFWDQVVGVALEDWMAASTTDELAALLAQRDA